MWWSKGKSQVTEGARVLASPMIMSLEPRMLFDGAVAATVADTAAQADSHATADAAKAPVADHPVASKDTHGQTDNTSAATPAPAATPTAVPGQSVVFVDSRIKDADSLLKGVAPGTEVVQLDSTKDGLQQIADYLDTHHGVSTVEIIAHGNSGDLWLGDTYLSADNVAARSAVLARIGNDMNVGGDILIYACNTAAGDKGISFVDSLAQLTGRDIAASNNRTGVSGDWDLEIATGTIESHNVLSAQSMAAYQYSLATLTVTNNGDSGVGSLRQALSDAVVGDTVTFSTTMTVNLNSQLTITKNVTLEGDLNHDGIADVTLNGQYKTRVVQVASGVTATFDGLIIKQGLVAGNGAAAGTDGTAAMGGGIFNSGNLTLKNVTVTSNAASGGGGGGGVTSPYVGGAVGGGGGGGGALGGQAGGHGGTSGFGTGVYGGTSGSANTGGNGGGYNPNYMGGHGGSSSGGAGGVGAANYSSGGAGGTANNGTISIGGGGGGSGWDKPGRAGASAAGGIYNASSGTLTVIGTSVISGNIAAGGGGGGGGGLGGSADSGGAAGKGVGAIWNKGTVLMTAANFAALSGNVGGSGSGGPALGGGSTGASVAAVNNIFNDGGTVNTAYAPAPSATIVVANSALHIGQTSLVTITFTEAVTGFTNADLTVANGSLSAVSSSDGGVTWTATFTPNSSVTGASNHIVLDNTGVTSVSLGTAGVGTSTSNNYAVDTVRPTATVVVSNSTVNIGGSTVTITFSEAVTGFSNADLTVANGTLSAVSSSDGGITWTATLTPTAGNNSTGNVITLDNTGYTDIATNAGTGTTTSNSYAIDAVRPTASIVVANNALHIGGTSLVTITFSEAVTGFTNADLTVADGTLSAVSSSDGGITWTATLTPTASVSHTGDIITLNNAGVSDTAGNAGSGTTNSNTYAVDTLRPTATIVVGTTILGIGQTSPVTITFSEAVTGFSNADLTVSNGTLSTVSSSDGGITWTATFTPTASITNAANHITLDNTTVQDLAGNAGSGTTTSNNYSIDGVRPTASIVVASPTLAIGQTSLVTITFSEGVVGFTNADLTIANGTLSAVSSTDGGITWTATFTPTASITNAANHITLDNTGYSDFSGNIGTGTTDSNNYTIDTQRPTATVVLANPTLMAGGSSLVTFTFSEAVTGFTNADLSVPNGTLTNVSSSDGGVTWTATFTPTTGIHATSNLISLNNSAVADLAGNTGTGITNSGNFTIDTVRPTATVVVATPTLIIGQTSLVTFTFNEAVTGFTNADLTVANGTLSAVSSSDGGITWTATFTPTTNITNAASHITLDNSGVQAVVSGNAGSGNSVSNTYAIDTQRPTATIVVANNALGIGSTSLVTITFSEAVTGFNNSDLLIGNGTLSAVSSSDGGITWTATLTPVNGITHNGNVITLNNTSVSDLSGNAGTGTTDSNTYAVDSQRPTAAIVVANPTLIAGQTSLVTITFSEAVTGFNNSDLSVPNGTLTNVSSSDGGVTWTATFTPTTGIHNTTNLISLNNSAVADLAGNTGTGITNSGNFTIDTVRPTATVVVANPTLNIGQTSLVTITFSEAVSGFTNADLSIANGTLSAVSSSDGGITWTATFTPTANITNAASHITLDNTLVQNASGNVGTGTTDSNNYAIDTQRPTATVVVANPALSIGQTSLVTITFSEAVTGFSNADLTIANGTLSAVSSSDGGITWTATYTPTSNISNATNHITLNNTGVNDLAGNAGSGTTDSNNYLVDTQRPTATIVVANPSLAVGGSSLVTFTFSEAVTGFTTADLTVANGTISGLSSSDGGVTWTATLTPTNAVTAASNLITLDNTRYTDLSGNAGTGTTHSNTYAIDTQRPTATVVIADSALKIGQSSTVSITFSEAVSGFTNADLTVANGTLSAVSSSDGGVTWTATFTPTNNVSSATNLITLNNTGVTDAAGNTGTGSTDSNNFAIDTARPTATIVVANPTLPIGETSLVTITFSEAVTGFSNADLTIANGTLSAVSSSDGGITWTATYTPTSNISNATNHITLNNAGVIDLAGNAGSGTTDSNNYIIDTQRPTAMIVVTDSALKLGQTTTVTITFSEAISGFTNSDLTVANGTLSALSSSDGGKTWTATLTPNANVTDASNLITLNNAGVIDALGNAGSGSTDSGNYVIDTTRPTATIVVANPMLPIGETSLVTITFSEAVSGFDNSDLTVANGTLSAVSSRDGGVTWTATFTPTSNVSDTRNLISLNNSGVHDAAGNTGAGSTDSNNYQIDTQRPTATIVVANGNLGIGQTSLVTITFSEAVSGFTNSDLTVANGTLSALSSSDGGKTWTATLTPTANITDASNLITLNNGGVSDAFGNTGSGTTDSNNYVIDTQRPTSTIVVASGNLGVGQTSLVTITFSEAVSGLTNADLTVANGTLSGLSSNDGGKTWTATLTPNINVNNATSQISLNNAGVSDTFGNTGIGSTESNSYVVKTIALTGDPQFRISDPAPPSSAPTVPLQPIVFTPPTGNLGSPLTFAPLFEQRVLGDGMRPLGDIFINRGELSPSFIAQVFTSGDSDARGSGHGFLGFGSGEGGVFGTSTLSSLFSHESTGAGHSLNTFGDRSILPGGDASSGLHGVFGALTLGEQLQQLENTEKQQIQALAKALQQVGISEMQA
ncbi:Ig-like domain-containing protein [Pseudomonas sp. 6D_7.1_Bac1]|uniref:Ig-like domain-containing protein n=1 Tax=Pseudomonas sp. 6D_7.1_Bac1 TaxID=2971615 RepID=UPI0021CA642D|nr:Ig-like domain-containing protein [Pseudomonas sp. 6D_7.1_Bac1]MCU1749459.1 Ig-like domain-containing protein [Pseudomonas sp. 6D_7.1_Bac1]